MRVLIVTGSRHEEMVAKHWANSVLTGVELLIVGDATGVDSVFRRYALLRGIKVAAFHAFWKQEGNAAGPTRNSAMVDLVVLLRRLGAEVVGAAFPGLNSVGTWDCVDRIKAVGIPLTVFSRDSIEEFHVTDIIANE